jgi:glycosyltransferase involved in cell wall biosynthesis
MITLIIPCRNEYGTISEIIDFSTRLPGVTQVLVVDGSSTDDTYSLAEKTITSIKQNNLIEISLFPQLGKGKWDAVLLGVTKSINNYVSIWDADLSVSFSEQTQIHERFLTYFRKNNKPCLAMGERMSKREPGAMKILNYFGNLFFAKLWTFITKKKIPDMLCGSKIFPVFTLENVPSFIMEMDPYGDFTIILGSVLSELSLEIQTLTYRARVYGQTNILRWSGAWQLLNVSYFSYRHLRKNLQKKES